MTSPGITHQTIPETQKRSPTNERRRIEAEQGCRIAARTYRAWKKASAPTMADIEVAHVVNAILDVIWIVDAEGRRRLAPEGLYGRRKLTALLRRQGHDVNGYVVDKAMRLLGHAGIRRGRQVRTTIPGKDGRRAGDLLNRDFTAAAPNRVWVADFERHEAFVNLGGGGRPPPHSCRSRGVEAGGRLAALA